MANSKTSLLKGAALLGIGQFVSYGSSFIRNLILARILTKADFGLASAMSITITLLEFVSRMSFGRQIIQAPEGDSPSFQSAAHSVQFACGLLSSFLVLISAYPMALAFGVPEQTWAFALLAAVPILRGFIHLDLARFQRDFNYAPFVYSDVIPQLFTALISWPIAKLMGDFRAVLWIMIIKELITLILSHLFAKRQYRWSWDKNIVTQMLKFGWPLLLNGLVLFVSRQGDQMLVGATFTLSDLSVYSISFMLPSTAFSIFAAIGSSLMLPSLSKNQSEPDLFRLQYQRCLEIAVVSTLIFLGPLVFMGSDIVKILYGSKYSNVGSLVTIFGVIMALRFFRWAPSIAAMSKADTTNQLIGNIVRSTSFVFALLIIIFGHYNLPLIASCGILGELLSISTVVFLAYKKHGIKFSSHFRPLIYLVTWLSIGCLANYFFKHVDSYLPKFIILFSLISIGFVAALFLFRDLSIFFRKTILNKILSKYDIFSFKKIFN